MPCHRGRVRLRSLKIEVDAGTYYIGDPGYAFPDPDEWEEFLNAIKTYSLHGCGAVVFFTPDGDGLYLDQHCNPYSVDSGLIGVLLVENIPPSVDREELERLGQIRHFDSSFLVEYDGDSETARFGDIEIDLGHTYTEA